MVVTIDDTGQVKSIAEFYNNKYVKRDYICVAHNFTAIYAGRCCCVSVCFNCTMLVVVNGGKGEVRGMSPNKDDWRKKYQTGILGDMSTQFFKHHRITNQNANVTDNTPIVTDASVADTNLMDEGLESILQLLESRASTLNSLIQDMALGQCKIPDMTSTTE